MSNKCGSDENKVSDFRHLKCLNVVLFLVFLWGKNLQFSGPCGGLSSPLYFDDCFCEFFDMGVVIIKIRKISMLGKPKQDYTSIFTFNIKDFFESGLKNYYFQLLPTMPIFRPYGNSLCRNVKCLTTTPYKCLTEGSLSRR